MHRRKFISGALSFGAMGSVSGGSFAGAGEVSRGKKKIHFPVERENSRLMISVKAVKAGVSFCKEPPAIEFSSSPASWRLTSQPNDHGDFYGENLREIYFNIESNERDFSPAEVKIIAPGVRVARVIVGYTDVPFEQQGDAVHFKLTDDRSRGQLMQLEYQSPMGGYPIAFIHNWEIRKAKEYALEDFPAVEFAAVNNYLMAAQEVLRQMGNMGPEPSKFFKGDIVLMGSEAAATRGHMDYPPHVHIMHYEFAEKKYENWTSRLVPHFYMDRQGNINRNKYDRIVGKGTPSGKYGPGDPVCFEDSDGRHVMDLVIDRGGLILRHPDKRVFSIRPDPEHGAAHAVYGYHDQHTICRAEVRDYPDIGTFRIRLDILNNERAEKTIHDGYLYDPFTPNKFRSLYSQFQR